MCERHHNAGITPLILIGPIFTREPDFDGLYKGISFVHGGESTINLSDLTLIRLFFSDFKAGLIPKMSELEVINNMESMLIWEKITPGKRD